MKVTKEWLLHLCEKYGVKPNEISKAIWPTNPKRSLVYFDNTENIGVKYIEMISDVLKCSVDEILRRPNFDGKNIIAGDNNQVGNVNINSDVDSLKQIIASQQDLISHQKSEITRLNETLKTQLKAKDQQIDRLIALAQTK
jgi:hypothetical protein